MIPIEEQHLIVLQPRDENWQNHADNTAKKVIEFWERWSDINESGKCVKCGVDQKKIQYIKYRLDSLAFIIQILCVVHKIATAYASKYITLLKKILCPFLRTYFKYSFVLIFLYF